MKKQVNGLGTYQSIFEGIEDELERDLMSEELRRNHRRPIRVIRRAVKVRYWLTILRWGMEEIAVYIPLVGVIWLVMFLLVVSLY